MYGSTSPGWLRGHIPPYPNLTGSRAVSSGAGGGNGVTRLTCPGCGKDCSGPFSHGWKKFKGWCSRHPWKAATTGVVGMAGLALCTLTFGPIALLGAGLVGYSYMTRDYVPQQARCWGYSYPAGYGSPYPRPPFGAFAPQGMPPAMYQPQTYGFGNQQPPRPMASSGNVQPTSQAQPPSPPPAPGSGQAPLTFRRETLV